MACDFRQIIWPPAPSSRHGGDPVTVQARLDQNDYLALLLGPRRWTCFLHSARAIGLSTALRIWRPPRACSPLHQRVNPRRDCDRTLLRQSGLHEHTAPRAIGPISGRPEPHREDLASAERCPAKNHVGETADEFRTSHMHLVVARLTRRLAYVARPRGGAGYVCRVRHGRGGHATAGANIDLS